MLHVFGIVGECLVGLALLWVLWRASCALSGTVTTRDSLEHLFGLILAIVLGGAYEWLLIQSLYLLCTWPCIALIVAMLIVKAPDDTEWQ